MSESHIVCFCNKTPTTVVEKAILNGAHTLTQIYDQCGAGSGPCGGSCRGNILALIARLAGTSPESKQVAPDAAATAPEALIEAISLFNRRYYWETHEVLEKVWMDETGPARKFYQGLIQAAAALYHVLNANPKGVIRLAEEAVLKLTPYRPAYMGVPLDSLCESLTSYALDSRRILGGDVSGFNYDALPFLIIGDMMETPTPAT